MYFEARVFTIMADFQVIGIGLSSQVLFTGMGRSGTSGVEGLGVQDL